MNEINIKELIKECEAVPLKLSSYDEIADRMGIEKAQVSNVSKDAWEKLRSNMNTSKNKGVSLTLGKK
jgi:DNA-directed RNA polymerase specialized sigma subunit